MFPDFDILILELSSD